jgi:hypothetical protein
LQWRRGRRRGRGGGGGQGHCWKGIGEIGTNVEIFRLVNFKSIKKRMFLFVYKIAKYIV